MIDQTEWGRLGAAVNRGELNMDRGVARQCAQRCADFAEQLRGLQRRARSLGKVDGFGTLPSGLALQAKFERKAVGGDGSLVEVLSAHIAEAERMRDVFEKIEARYAATEDTNTAALEGIDTGR